MRNNPRLSSWKKVTAVERDECEDLFSAPSVKWKELENEEHMMRPEAEDEHA